MRVILCDNYEKVSAECAKLISGQIMLKPDSVLGLATGSTPLGTYAELCRQYESGELDFSGITTFNLDEYYPISKDNPQSYHYFMEENLFSKVNINKSNTNIPDGSSDDPEKECARYEKAIKAAGGIDLQLLGIGQNGHIGFNEPSAAMESGTHITNLTQSTINANARFFDSPDDVPRKAITMGIATILSAKKIILLACGTSKHKVIKELLTEQIKTSVPATILNVHRDVVIICDKEAYYGK